MKRIVPYAVAVASVPAGISVGLWMALLTSLPPCVVRGLGTLDLCAAQPQFSTWVCVLCGATVTASLLLIAVALSRPVSRVAIFDVGAAAMGVVVGVWTSLMAYTYPPCGPHQSCVTLVEQRFTGWESALIGGASTIAILLVGAAMNPECRLVNVRAARTLERWLFKDLSTITPVSDSSSDAN